MTVVVAGAGQAGGEACAALRMAGYDGEIVLIGDEEHLPYSRPPLSKAYLMGKATTEELYLRPAHFYPDHGIRTVLDHSLTEIDHAAGIVTLDSGETIRYSSLILALGGHARRLDDDVAKAAPNVHYLRRISDVDALRPGFVAGARLVIVGGGYVGLEVAAVARQLGMQVTVVEAAPRLLARVAGPDVSSFFHRLHTEEGVDIHVGTQVTGFEAGPGKEVTAVCTGHGPAIPADLVLVGIGLVANDAVAENAGIEVDNGIIVDDRCRTSVPGIFAIGDCSRHPCSEHGGLRRLESVPNASEQARVVASTVVGGDRSYTAVPWFWSDQYEVKLQSAGIATGHDTVVLRGSATQGRQFTAFYLKDGQVRAADVVGSPREFAPAKKLVAGRAQVTAGQLADLSLPLKALLAQVTAAAPAR